jgi:hypothetical protein
VKNSPSIIYTHPSTEYITPLPSPIHQSPSNPLSSCDSNHPSHPLTLLIIRSTPPPSQCIRIKPGVSLIIPSQISAGSQYNASVSLSLPRRLVFVSASPRFCADFRCMTGRLGSWHLNHFIQKSMRKRSMRLLVSRVRRVTDRVSHAQFALPIRTLFYSAHIHTIESSRRLADVLACSQKVSHPEMRLVSAASWRIIPFSLLRTLVHAGFCMFPQSCDLRTETAGSL